MSAYEDDDADFDALLEKFKLGTDAPRPDWALDPNKSIDEQLEALPFFMTKLPENMHDNTQLQALQALLYNGTPEEIAANFKDQGNGAYKRGQAGYKDAISFYTKGIEQRSSDVQLNAQLYNNRAAANLALKNFGAAARDSAQSISFDQNNAKAFWRAAKATLALEKMEEAEQFCHKGLVLFPESDELRNVSAEVESAKRRFEQEREKRAVSLQEAHQIETAMLKRGVKKIIDAEKRSLVELGPGLFGPNIPKVKMSSSAKDSLQFPVIFMYPPVGQFDFVESADEQSCLYDHLSVMFAHPADWDLEKLYSSIPRMTAYLLPVQDPSLESTEKTVYRVALKTPLQRLLGSVLKCYEFGLLFFYILPSLTERARFEAKFPDHLFVDIA